MEKLKIIIKYLIPVITTFFIMPLSINYLGVSIVILYLSFILLFGKKDIYPIIITSLLYIFYFDETYFVFFLVCEILLVSYLFIKRKDSLLSETIVFTIVHFILQIKDSNNFLIKIILILIFSVIYYLLKSLFSKNIIAKGGIISFILCFMAVGGSLIDFRVNIGYLIGFTITAIISLKNKGKEGLIVSIFLLVYFGLTGSVLIAFLFPLVYIVFSEMKIISFVLLLISTVFISLYLQRFNFIEIIFVIIFVIGKIIIKPKDYKIVEKNSDMQIIMEFFDLCANDQNNKDKEVYKIITKMMQSIIIDEEIRNQEKEKIDILAKQIINRLNITNMEGQIANDNYYFSFFTKEKDKNRIESILNNIVSDRIKIKYEDINENTKVIVTKKPNILFDYQTKEIAKNIISGDVIHCKERDNGNSTFIICDGMGKGIKAKEESENTIRLVNKLLTSNLSSFCICQLINYYKKVRDEERFCTLDYLEINPFTKKGYLYKQGSATTYIFKNDKRVIKIENKNLPLGKEEEINERKISFEEGDVVFLASDGLFDNVYNEKGLIEYIKTLLYMPSEQIVYYLLDYSVKLKGITKDDISVICIKIL